MSFKIESSLSKNDVERITIFNAPTSILSITLNASNTGTGLSIAQSETWNKAGLMFVNGAAPTANHTITLGADTSANAKALLKTFGVENNNKSRILEIQKAQGAPNAAFFLNIGNGASAGVVGSTSTNVRFSSNGGAVGASATYANVSASSVSAYLRVSQAGDNIILFDVLKSLQA